MKSMARKRYSRRRSKGRFAFLYKLLAFMVICTAITLALTLFFRIRTIHVSGNSRYDRDTIIQAAQIREGDNLFLMNKYDAAARIRRTLPYVETVQFRRTLPDTLSIVVTECTSPAAVIQDGQAYLLCDKGIIVDQMSPAAAKKLPQVEGLTLIDPVVGSEAATADDQTLALEQLLELLQALDDRALAGDVQSIDLTDPSQITLRYLDRFDVCFPRSTDYGYKLDYLLAVVEKLEINEKGTINMMQDGKARFIPE